jgi:putative membrane protein
MRIIRRVALSSLAVLAVSYVLPGVALRTYASAIAVALLLGFLRAFLQPLLILISLPVTILSFGLFLFVINAIIVLLADGLLIGFSVQSFGSALLFSLLLSLTQSILYSLFEKKENRT